MLGSFFLQLLRLGFFFGQAGFGFGHLGFRFLQAGFGLAHCAFIFGLQLAWHVTLLGLSGLAMFYFLFNLAVEKYRSSLNQLLHEIFKPKKHENFESKHSRKVAESISFLCTETFFCRDGTSCSSSHLLILFLIPAEFEKMMSSRQWTIFLVNYLIN